jgi:putative nucleotidyltransferase with HDIG domain
LEVSRISTLPALPEESAQEQGQASAGRLVALTALICSVLRSALRFSWLDREVYNQTLILQQLLVDQSREQPLRLEFTAKGLAARGEEMTQLPRAVRQLHGMVRRKGLRALVFHPDVSVREVMELLRLLQTKEAAIGDDLRQLLEHVELSAQEGGPEASIELPQVLKRSRLGSMLSEDEGAGREVREMVGEITSAIETITQGHSNPEAAPVGQRNSTLSALAGNMGGREEITLILASLRRHDPYTYDHSINVGLLSIALARAIGWKGRDLEEFGVAALIHDIGKLYTPLEVLNKPGRFTPVEWSIMKKHPADGADILREAACTNEIAPRIAIEHHLNMDGTGYPPLPYKDILRGSRIVKIADVYDAFTTIRPYRSQARPFEVLKMLRKQAGTAFDSELVEAFCSMMGVYPIGSVVKLKSGPIGLVVETNIEASDRPVVRVLQDERGRRPRQTTLLDLAALDPETGQHTDEIVECIDPVIRNIDIGRYI